MHTPADIEGAFGAAIKNRSDAIYLSFDSVIFRHEQLIAELLAKHPLPAMAPSKTLVTRGALMTYWPNFDVLNQRRCRLRRQDPQGRQARRTSN